MTSEGLTTASFQVVLTEPTDCERDDSRQFAGYGRRHRQLSSLIFTDSDWSTPQSITITGIDDVLDDGDVAYTVNSPMPAVPTQTTTICDPDDVSVLNVDNDVSSFDVQLTSGLTTTEPAQRPPSRSP